MILKPKGIEILFKVSDHEDESSKYQTKEVLGTNANGEYRLISLTAATNIWGLFSSMNRTNSSVQLDEERTDPEQQATEQRPRAKFYDQIRFGKDRTGIEQIFEGFELGNVTYICASQFVNSKFIHLHYKMFA